MGTFPFCYSYNNVWGVWQPLWPPPPGIPWDTLYPDKIFAAGAIFLEGGGGNKGCRTPAYCYRSAKTEKYPYLYSNL